MSPTHSPSADPAQDRDLDPHGGAWVRADEPLLPRALRRTLSLPASLYAHRALWIAGARRELRARLSGTLLGRLWPVVGPLALFGVYYALFARAFGMGFPGLGPEASRATGVWLFLGVVTWSAFAESLGRGTAAFVERGELLKRAAFPAEVLPFQAIVAQHLLLAAGLCAFVVVVSLAGLWPPPGAGLLWTPLLLCLQMLFVLGLTLASATLHAFLRDTAHAVGLLTTLWMFATPIFWIPSERVLPGVGPFLPWLAWNPMHAFVSCWRHALMPGAPAEGFTTDFGTSLATAGLWTAGALCVGGFLFSLGLRRLPDEV